jgi:probable F420-dependent oxidoreductase
MKVRIGIGFGTDGGPEGFADAVRRLEELDIDSLWLSEVVSTSQVDPFIGMSFALGRTTRLKVGTGVAVLPGRHPMLVAKQLVSLAGLAPRRVLPVFGLQPARQRERVLFEVPPGRRGAMFDESLDLLRHALAEETVSFHGEFFDIEGVGVGPLPAKPLDIWLGGSGPVALERVGRFGDGWLGSFVTPAEAGRKREAIQEAAAKAGREIELDHFGLSLAVATDGVPPDYLEAVRSRRSDVDPAELIAGGWADARRLISDYVEAGLTKFVVRPVSGELDPFLDGFVRELMPLQT